MDGGSTDNTVKILKSYGDKIKWISEPDNGQTHAINRGLKLATGDILAYLNSDDLYTPNTLLTVGKYFIDHQNTDWITGSYSIIDQNNRQIQKQTIIIKYKKFLLSHYRPYFLRITNSIIPQPSTFWSRNAYQKVGNFDESLHYAMDYDYWLKLNKHFKLHYISDTLSLFRMHPSSKSTTSTKSQFQEELSALKQHSTSLIEVILHRLHTVITLAIYKYIR